MAKKPAKNNEAESNGAAAAGEEAPTLNSLAQYVKDFSFENPKAPFSLQGQQEQPEIAIGVNVNVEQMSETEFEVSLNIDADAKSANETLFKVELHYAGVFRITGVPADNLQPVLLIECPRLLFPFARQIIAEGTRNGGFPPLMIDPVDFAALYRQRLTEAMAEAEGNA